MRNGVWAAVALCAAAAGQARAQSGASTILGGAAPSSLTFKPIDMSNMVVAPGMSAQQTHFNFSSILRKLSFSNGPPTLGVSPLPSPGSFPSTKFPSAKMVGAPPQLIGDPKRSQNPFQPVMPIANPQRVTSSSGQ
jgi:hypothetical protein